MRAYRVFFFVGGGFSLSPLGIFLVNLFLTKLVRISGFSSLFSAIAVFLSTFVGGYRNTAIAEKREEKPEILTNLVRISGLQGCKFRLFALPILRYKWPIAISSVPSVKASDCGRRKSPDGRCKP